MKFNTVLITGASRGIGKGVALAFAEKGYNVAINYIGSEEKAQELCDEINAKNGGRAMKYKADVSVPSQVRDMVSSINKKFGRITVLVNNAGVDKQGIFQTQDEDDMDFVMKVNVKGIFNTCKAVLPQMIEAKYGKIINISSVLGIEGSSYEAVYSASKGAVNAFTKALAKEVGPSNINVNAIAPGVINTDMMKAVDEKVIKGLVSQTPSGRVGMPSDIAQVCLFLASDSASFVQGVVLPVSGGWLV